MKSLFFLIAMLFSFMSFGQSYAIPEDTQQVITSSIVAPQTTEEVKEEAEQVIEQVDVTMPLLENWFQDGWPVVLSAITLLLGMFSEKIPFFKKIGDTGLRVITLVVLLGGGYILFGGDIWQVAISYVVSILFYHGAVRPATKGQSFYKGKKGLRRT